MSLIVSTKKPVGAYKILIESCIKHCENLTKKKNELDRLRERQNIFKIYFLFTKKYNKLIDI